MRSPPCRWPGRWLHRFLAGPPLIGFLAQSAGVLRALLVLLAALLLGVLTAGAADFPGPRCDSERRR
ncbi:MAG TPA: hypothetical protein VGJ13_15900 [Pseudonocardiaceae bacterium]